MPERTVSFRYDATHTKEWYENFFRELTANQGLKLAQDRTDTLSICSQDQIDRGVARVFPDPEQLETLRKAGRILLRPDKNEALCREVTIQTLIFENKDGTVKMCVDSTEQNEFPCLVADLWLDDEFELPGGFVKIEAPSKEYVDAVALEFLAATGRGL